MWEIRLKNSNNTIYEYKDKLFNKLIIQKFNNLTTRVRLIFPTKKNEQQ